MTKKQEDILDEYLFHLEKTLMFDSLFFILKMIYVYLWSWIALLILYHSAVMKSTEL